MIQPLPHTGPQPADNFKGGKKVVTCCCA